MVAPEQMVLADDASVRPVRDLPTALGTALGRDPGDYLVGRPGWRTPSLLVDQSTVELLNGFRQPCSVVSAVLAFSEEAGLDPRFVLREAHPVLRKLVAAGVLVQAGSPAAQPLAPALAAGERFGPVTVCESVQICRDTEIHRATEADGTAV